MLRQEFTSNFNINQFLYENGYTNLINNSKLTYSNEYYYSFSKDEIKKIKNITNNVNSMIHQYIYDILYDNKYDIDLPTDEKEILIKSFEKNPLPLCFRLDFGFKNGNFFLYEVNTETPGLIIESELIQSKISELFEFNHINKIHNNIHKYFSKYLNTFKDFYFVSSPHKEDVLNTKFLASIANQAGFNIFLDTYDELLISENDIFYKNTQDINKINLLYKMIPSSELTLSEKKAFNNILSFQPLWTSIIEDKIFLSFIYDKYSNKYDFIIPTYKHLLNAIKETNGHFIKKNRISSRSENISVYKNGIFQSPIDNQSAIYQKYIETESFNGNFPIISSFLIGNQFSGIAIRDSNNPITQLDNIFISYNIL